MENCVEFVSSITDNCFCNLSWVHASSTHLRCLPKFTYKRINCFLCLSCSSKTSLRVNATLRLPVSNAIFFKTNLTHNVINVCLTIIGSTHSVVLNKSTSKVNNCSVYFIRPCVISKVTPEITIVSHCLAALAKQSHFNFFKPTSLLKMSSI